MKTLAHLPSRPLREKAAEQDREMPDANAKSRLREEAGFLLP
jgi:hypothetical protein